MKKVLLKDLQPDEVIRRLKAGEVVKDECSKEIIKMIEGILCSVSDLGNTRLNILLNPLCPDYYFEEPEELKLEVGKFYRTRDGRKVFIFITDDYNYRGVIENSNNDFAWREKGKSVYSTDDNNLDLVSEWSDEDVADE